MASIQELESQINALEGELRGLKHQLRDSLIEASPFRATQIIKDRKGKEAQIVRVEVNYGQVVPIVVYRKKDGEWGNREYTLYSWDLPEQAA